jgi:1,4-alpha-glucan branching enzyme
MIEREVRENSVRVTFSLPATEDEVSVVGSFNDWDPLVHQLQSDGPMQSVTVELQPGTNHEFRYLASDGRWFDDPDADGRHGENGVLVIAEMDTPDPVDLETGDADVLAAPQRTRRKSAGSRVAS